MAAYHCPERLLANSTEIDNHLMKHQMMLLSAESWTYDAGGVAFTLVRKKRFRGNLHVVPVNCLRLGGSLSVRLLAALAEIGILPLADPVVEELKYIVATYIHRKDIQQFAEEARMYHAVVHEMLDARKFDEALKAKDACDRVLDQIFAESIGL